MADYTQDDDYQLALGRYESLAQQVTEHVRNNTAQTGIQVEDLGAGPMLDFARNGYNLNWPTGVYAWTEAGNSQADLEALIKAYAN